MDELAEIRNQEMMCRERALSDPERTEFWLAKAEEWAQRALDQIAFLFRESNGADGSSVVTTVLGVTHAQSPP